MSGIWRTWMFLWCISVGVFGLILTLGAIEATSGPTKLLLTILSGGEAPQMTPHLKFCLAFMGPVTLGWCLTLLGATQAANQLEGESSRTLWAYITAGVLTWAIVDSILSIATGFGLNLIPNALYLIAYFVPVLKSGVLQRN